MWNTAKNQKPKAEVTPFTFWFMLYGCYVVNMGNIYLIVSVFKLNGLNILFKPACFGE